MTTTKWQLGQRIALIAGVAILVACSWLAPVDTTAKQQVDAGLNRALISFASARALNAVISVAQGTEVALEPGGVGVVLTPGEVLDPVNDLVEDFSNLMLVASVSFGVQKVLINIGSDWVISLLLTMAAALWALFYFRRKPASSWLARALIVLLIVRFAVPFVAIGSDMLFNQFMAADYQASQKVIEAATGSLSELNPPVAEPAEERGIIDKLRGLMPNSDAIRARYDNLKQVAETVTEHIVTLMALFLLQTLVIPLALLWLLFAAARRAFTWPAGS